MVTASELGIIDHFEDTVTAAVNKTRYRDKMLRMRCDYKMGN